MDLPAYLQRIGHEGDIDVTPATLAALASGHARSIPFENIDALAGRRVSLDPDEVFDKLVRRGRGGWCFEQNLLLGEGLRALGFDVTDLAGRVLWGRGVEAVTPRTHRALLVRIDGCDWLADVGFGGQSVTGALELSSREVQQVGHDHFRIGALDGDQLLSVRIRGEWLPMYRFDLQPQWPVDFEAANFQLCTDPASLFTQQLTLSLAATDGRHALRGRELVFHDAAGNTRRRELGSADELLAAVRDVFGLALDPPTHAALAAKLASPAG